MHLGTIGMLHKETAIFIGDRAYIVFSDHHLSVCDCICLSGAWNWLQVLINVVLEAAPLALVIRNDPLHGLFAEVGHDTVRVQHLSITVM